MRRVVTGLGISLAGLGVLCLAMATAFGITDVDAAALWALWGFGALLVGAVAASTAQWGARGALLGAGITFLVLGFGMSAAAVSVLAAAEQYLSFAPDDAAFEAIVTSRLFLGAGLLLMFAGAIAIALFAYVNQQAERGDARPSDASVGTSHGPLRDS